MQGEPRGRGSYGCGILDDREPPAGPWALPGHSCVLGLPTVSLFLEVVATTRHSGDPTECGLAEGFESLPEPAGKRQLGQSDSLLRGIGTHQLLPPPPRGPSSPSTPLQGLCAPPFSRLQSPLLSPAPHFYPGVSFLQVTMHTPLPLSPPTPRGSHTRSLRRCPFYPRVVQAETSASPWTPCIPFRLTFRPLAPPIGSSSESGHISHPHRHCPSPGLILSRLDRDPVS